MNVSTLGILLASLLVTCHANFISFDVKVAELSGGKEVNSEESEVFIDEYYLSTEPPAIELEYDGDEDAADDEQEDDFIGRETFNVSDIEFQMSFGKGERHHPDEHMNFAIGFGQTGLGSSPDWSEWTCCRRVVNIRSRQRIVQSPRIEMEYKRCKGPYCQASMCKDNMGLCQNFISSMGRNLCDPSHMMATFMSHHCPQTCNFCGSGPEEPPALTTTSFPWRPHTSKPTRRPFVPTTTKARWQTRKPTTTKAPFVFSTTRRPRPTTRPWWQATTRSPVSNSKLVKVTILSHDLNRPYPSYKYSIEDRVIETTPWRKIPENQPDLSHFYLYREPTDTFKTAIRFCSGIDLKGVEKWTVTKRPCSRGWQERFILYASLYRSKSDTLYYVGNGGSPLWTARVSTRFPSKGYTRSLFFFYGPKPESVRPTPRPRPTFPISSRPTRMPRPTPRPRPTFTTRRPFSPRPTRPVTPRPFPVTTRRPFLPFPLSTRQPIPVTTKPRPGPGRQPTNAFNRECLEAHNFFRAAHNVPPLQWSPELAKTANAWADQLKRIAPERPNQLKLPNKRTRNWPHSDSGKGFRNRGDGENIAWDLSSDGSPAKESVLRWYSEIFYYNRKHPTHAPAADKPVGHLTQMLWKDTTKLGCGVAETTVGRFKQLSTWTVSHYSPGGNIRYGNSAAMTLKLYNEQVPDMRAGSCMTKSGACTMGNQCMAFGPSRGSCACTNNKASCRGRNGCIAWCQNRNRKWPWKEECQGNYECSCTNEGAVCK